MKSIVRSILVNSFSLFLLSVLLPGVRIANGLVGLILSGIVLSILMLILKPIITIVTFPLSIITFGLYALVGGIISVSVVFFVLTRLQTGVTIVPFTLEKMRINTLDIPVIHLNAIFAFVAVSIAYLVMKGVFSWLTQE